MLCINNSMPICIPKQFIYIYSIKYNLTNVINLMQSNLPANPKAIIENTFQKQQFSRLQPLAFAATDFVHFTVVEFKESS